VSAARVVVTGVGLVTPLGNEAGLVWQRLEEGRTGIGPIRAFDTGGCPVGVAAEVPGEPALAAPAAARLPRLARRSSRLGVAAAAAAISDAGVSSEPSARPAAYVGTLPGELDHLEAPALGRGAGFDARELDPWFLFRHLPNNTAFALAAGLGFRGPIFGLASACAAGAVAIGEALQALRRDEFDWVLAGGACAAVTPLGVMGLALIHALSTASGAEASRPFDARRDGFVLGEGAAFLVLERAARASARGARIYAEVAGYGAAMDGGALLTDPDPSGEGAARAMQAALASAGCAVEEVDCIKAHGTSTRANDRMETRAIRRVFGARAERIPVTAPKSMLGHSLAAAGAVEAAAALGILAREAIPPTINYSTADPECDLDYVPNQARPARVDTLLLNSFGMGGHNAALVIRRAA
jgi:3-oxoacyl-[acyl-carrier-protein] synthase II